MKSRIQLLKYIFNSVNNQYKLKFVIYRVFKKLRNLDIWPRNSGLSYYLILIIVLKALFRYKINWRAKKLSPKYKEILIIPFNQDSHSRTLKLLHNLLSDFIIYSNFYMIQLNNHVCIRLSPIDKIYHGFKYNLILIDNIEKHHIKVINKILSEYILRKKHVDILLGNSGIPTNIEPYFNNLSLSVKLKIHSFFKLGMDPLYITNQRINLSPEDFRKKFSLKSEYY